MSIDHIERPTEFGQVRLIAGDAWDEKDSCDVGVRSGLNLAWGGEGE